VAAAAAVAAAQQQGNVTCDAQGRCYQANPQAQQQPTTKDALDNVWKMTNAAPSGQSNNAPVVPPSYSLNATNTQMATSANAPTPLNLQFQNWQDPAEGAFFLQVPVGWGIAGGTQRNSKIEAHYTVRVQSPSGQTQIFMDDPRLVIRQFPNAGTQMLGWREGQMVQTSGMNLLISRYVPADQAAAGYIQQYVCPSATNFRGGIIQGPTADLNRLMVPVAQAEGKQMRADVGELAFQCGAQEGYVYAVTVAGWMPDGSVGGWAFYRLEGFLTTPQEHRMAAAAMEVMQESFQMNPQWVQMFAQQAQDATGNVQRESNALTQASIDYSKQIQAVQEQNYAAWRRNQDTSFNAIRGANNAITNNGAGRSTGDGHDYNWVLGTKSVCNEYGEGCKTVDANVEGGKYFHDCKGNYVLGSPAGDPPPANLSACGWQQGH
jgi:hypothetical protein